MATPNAPAPAPTKPRDPYLDNARSILITLVVIGHVVESIGSYWAGALYTWLYAFHMPAFVVISGYLSRSFRNEPRQLARLLSAVAVPYVIFEGIHAAIRMAMGSEVNLNLWEPAWTLWFLLALFFWRLLTPLLRALRHPLLISIGVSLLAPLDGHLDETLSWGRVLSFLPFFTLGLIATPEHVQRLRDFRYRILGAVLLAAGLALSFLMHDEFSATLLFMREGYEDVGLTGVQGLIVRAAVLLAGTAATLALLVITPKDRYWWTAIGRRSLTVYLLHGAILRPFKGGEFLESITDPLPTMLAVLAAIALTILLSRAWVVHSTRWLTNPPIGHWLVSADPHTTPRAIPRPHAERSESPRS